MRPFVRPLEEFHAQTAPSDWLEGLVKAYVGDGIGIDFYREITAYVDRDTRALVLGVCDDLGQSAFVVEKVRAAIAADPSCAGRLALWGRRLVGEAPRRPSGWPPSATPCRRCMVGGPIGGADLVEIGKMFGRMTEAHTRRMESLGLAA
jgi:hypothetical protein